MSGMILKYLELQNIKTKDIIFVIICLISIFILLFIPTGFEGAAQKKGIPAKSVVLETDNSRLQIIGLIKTGGQMLKIKILDGKYKGQTIETNNLFMGKMEFDKVYKPGDKVFTVLDTDNGKLIYANVIDHYRLNYEIILLSIFILILILYAGFVGLKALISFVFTGLLIWKIMLPLFLKGYNPLLTSVIIVIIFVSIIIFLVGGFSRKGITAFLGSLSGVFATGILSLIFGVLFKVNGAVRPFSEILLYSGFPYLDLSGIFLSGIFISSSGAVMDVAMDVSASMNELVQKNPDIKMREVIISGFNVGKVVIGTMTTTLLLAYSGGYATMMMVFIAQGTPILNVLNIQYVSLEILHTLVGSLGPVLVAPFTAIIGGLIFKIK
jgi:uncharacterized membrane protein